MEMVGIKINGNKAKQQSPTLGLTTVPIPDPQLRMGQLYPPITHPWHLIHTHYPPNSYPSVHHQNKATYEYFEVFLKGGTCQ